MSDARAAALGLGAVVGAWASWPVAPVAVVGLAVLALVLRHPVTTVVLVAALASFLGARAWSGMAPLDRAPFAGEVTLVSDPETVRGAVVAEVRAAGHRVEAWFRGAPAGRVRRALAGERLEVEGRLGPPPDDAPWLVPRHVVGRLDVSDVGAVLPADVVSRAANGLRRTLVEGAASLPDRPRALFAGLVLGDDREQDDVTADDFRGAGLSHLLAVSGQNVAFVLAVASPLTRRLGWRSRLVVTLAVLAFFALLTRFEPSVLRATAMAALAASAATWGRRASGRQLLALAVGGLVLVDPLLVHSIGFRLSVGASVGIGLLAEPLAARLRGPAAVRSALAVTVAAQAGVAPVLLPVFGGLPVASLPANVLAAGAAGPVMVWGLTAGLAAGVLGEPFAPLLHVPTRLLVGWIAVVARTASGLHLGDLTASHVALLALLGAAWATATPRRHDPQPDPQPERVSEAVQRRAALVTRSGRWGRAVRWGSAVGVVLVLVHPAVALRWASGDADLGPGAELRAGRVLVVGGEVVPGRVLEGLRRTGTGPPALVVATSGGVRASEAVAALRRRYGPVPVYAPPGHRVRGAVAPAPPWSMRAGGVVVHARARPPGGLVVDVEAVGPDGDRRAPG